MFNVEELLGVFAETLRRLTPLVQDLEGRVPPSQILSHEDGFIVRYKERLVEQAIFLKCAQLVSGLHASVALWQRGFMFELGILKRTLDECHDVIFFLAGAKITGKMEPVHQEYLDWFFHDLLREASKPSEVPRRKIVAAGARALPQDDPSALIHSSRAVMEALSGYVHGASVHLMEIVGGKPPRIFPAGMLGTARQLEHGQELWSYFYRGVLAFALACKALGNQGAFEHLHAFGKELAAAAGKDYFPD